MRILGLDLGTSSVKAVEIESGFGRYEIREYYEQPFGQGQTATDAAAQLIGSLPKAPDRISVSLPSRMVTQRNMTIPSKDKKAIKSAIMFELEDDLPLSLEDATFDYSILSQGSEGSQVHIAASISKNVQAYIDGMRAVGIDPDFITTESWAYRTFLNRVISTEAQDSPFLLVQIGGASTTFYAHWKGAPVFTRECNWGGNDLTAAIAHEFRISVNEAEKAKRDRGIKTPGGIPIADTDAIECRGEITQTLQAFVLEIRQASLTCRNLTGVNPSQILFCGGGSLVPGLIPLIEPELHAPIQNVQALSALSLSGVSYSEQSDAMFLLAASLALCMVGPDRSSAINFRKGLLSKTGGGVAIDFKTLKGPLIGAGIITASLAASLITESMLYGKKLKEEDLLLTKSVRTFMPSWSDSAIRTYIASPSKLKDQVQKELATQRELAMLFGKNAKSPLTFLKNLSQQVPSSVVVDMTHFQIGSASDAPYKQNADGTASLTFLVSNPQMIEKLSEIMPRFLDTVQKSNPEEVNAVDGSGKKLKVTFTGKPKEDAYGR